jgi:RHS repeat-associated protein
MYYNASWQLIEEHICDDWDDEEEEGETNRIGQLFWGLRYIDDLVFRREDRNLTNEPYPAEDPAEPDWEEAETPSWYALTDVQFSVVALITPTALVAERVVYDPYGRARQHHPTDYDGDGDATISDLYAFMSARTAGHIQADWDRDGDVDVSDLYAYLAVYTPYLSPVVDAGRISWEYTPGGISPLRPDNPIGYCGYVFNPETDDYTVRFRHYDPEIGRWLERDPEEWADESAYSYVMSNPDWTDPYGLERRPPRERPNTGPGGQGASRDKNRELQRKKRLDNRSRQRPSETKLKTPLDRVASDTCPPPDLTGSKGKGTRANTVAGGVGAIEVLSQWAESAYYRFLDKKAIERMTKEAAACQSPGVPVLSYIRGRTVIESEFVCAADACEAAELARKIRNQFEDGYYEYKHLRNIFQITYDMRPESRGKSWWMKDYQLWQFFDTQYQAMAKACRESKKKSCQCQETESETVTYEIRSNW